MDQDEKMAEREGYMLFVDPILGLFNMFMTLVTCWVVIEVLSTEHGRTMVTQLPTLIKTALYAHT